MLIPFILFCAVFAAAAIFILMYKLLQYKRQNDEFRTANEQMAKITEALSRFLQQSYRLMVRIKSLGIGWSEGWAPCYKDASELRWLVRRNFHHRILPEELDHLLKLTGGLWLHSGDPKDPHMRHPVTGRCVNGYLDPGHVLKYSNLCEIFAQELCEMYNFYRLKEHWQDTPPSLLFEPNWVISSGGVGSGLCYNVAHIYNSMYASAFSGENLLADLEFREGESVLQVEAVIWDKCQLQTVRDELVSCAEPATRVPVVVCLLNTSGLKEFEGMPILSVRDYHIQSWVQDECPLCANGSELLNFEVKEERRRLFFYQPPSKEDIGKMLDKLQMRQKEEEEAETEAEAA